MAFYSQYNLNKVWIQPKVGPKLKLDILDSPREKSYEETTAESLDYIISGRLWR